VGFGVGGGVGHTQGKFVGGQPVGLVSTPFHSLLVVLLLEVLFVEVLLDLILGLPVGSHKVPVFEVAAFEGGVIAGFSLLRAEFDGRA